jgi:hypothetical protein
MKKFLKYSIGTSLNKMWVKKIGCTICALVRTPYGSQKTPIVQMLIQIKRRIDVKEVNTPLAPLKGEYPPLPPSRRGRHPPTPLKGRLVPYWT